MEGEGNINLKKIKQERLSDFFSMLRLLIRTSMQNTAVQKNHILSTAVALLCRFLMIYDNS